MTSNLTSFNKGNLSVSISILANRAEFVSQYTEEESASCLRWKVREVSVEVRAVERTWVAKRKPGSSRGLWLSVENMKTNLFRDVDEESFKEYLISGRTDQVREQELHSTTDVEEGTMPTSRWKEGLKPNFQ